MKITPLRDLLVVRLLPTPAKPSLLVRVSDERTASHAEILVCGPEVKDARVGQRIVLSRHQGTQIDFGEPLVLVREGAILGTLP